MNFSFNVAWAHRYYFDYQKVPDGWYIGVNEAYKVSLYMILHSELLDTLMSEIQHSEDFH